MESAVSTVGEGPSANVVAEQGLEPSEASVCAFQEPLDQTPKVTVGGSVSPPVLSQAPDTLMSQEQKGPSVAPVLRQQLAVAEKRVCEALHQVMQSVEIKLSEVVKQAAIDIIDNLGKEAAECIVHSQRRVEFLQYQLNHNKQQALSMLTQAKRISDAQISQAENKISIERRRAEEAEANIHSMQESNKKLKAELKRKGQQLEELQRSISLAAAHQSLPVCIPEGSQRRNGANRSTPSAREKKFPKIEDARHEIYSSAMPPAAVIIVDRSANCISPIQTENASTPPLIHSSTSHNAYTATSIQTGLQASELLPQGRSHSEVKEEYSRTTENGSVTVPLHSQKQSARNDTASGSGADINTSVDIHPSHLSSQDSRSAISPVQVSLSPTEKGQVSPSPKAELESRSAKDSDEEKSSLTMEALYCNDESLPRPVHPVDEYQSRSTRVRRELERSERPKQPTSGCKRYGDEVGVSIHCTEELEMSEEPKSEQHVGKVETIVSGKTVAQMAVASPVTQNSSSDTPPRPLGGFPGIMSVSDPGGNKDPSEVDASRPDAQNGSRVKQVSKRKRNQGVTVSKCDLSVTDKCSNGLDGGDAVAGAFTPAGTGGVNAIISPRDSRRLMQGARQLFSLAERKWR